MHVNFSEQLWIDFDLEIEYFLRFLVLWITLNSQKDNPSERNLRDGLYWSYNSYPEFTKMLPGFTVKIMRAIVARCLKNDLIKIGQFNKKKYDNTNWYTLTEKGWSYFEREARKVYPERFVTSNRGDSELYTPAQMGRPPAQMGRPIPLTDNTLGDNIISVSDDTNSSKGISNQEIIDTYHQHLPELTRIKVIDRDLGNKINSMKKNWHKYQKDGKHFTLELFVNFLNFIRNYHSWFLRPRTTESGNVKKNSLRNLIAEKNLARFANGEFSAT